MKYSVILWDFNGTIMDDVYASLEAVNDMLTKRHQSTIDIERYRSAITTPIWGFYEEIFEPSTITVEEAIEEFDSGYNKHLKANPLMKNAHEILEFAKVKNIRQFVVSSSHIDKVTKLTESFGIRDYFDGILALSDYYAGDKSFLAKKYLEETDTSPASALVIGDTIMDYNMAKDLGCDCILISMGHQGRDTLLCTGVPVIDDLRELKKYIDE